MNQFVSEDKLTIKLPVPLGGTVYYLSTCCNDACMFQKETFNKIFPPTKIGRCSAEMPCHTKIFSISEKILTLDNLDWVLRGWGFHFFDEEIWARTVGEKRIEEHKEELLKLGLNIE